MQNTMVQPIKNLLKFEGQWRSYQKRVLDRADNYLKDKRIHIVAAPGSGKTTLGIELIRRLNQPALVLSPSINIRNQWIQRIADAYLPETVNAEEVLSNNIRKPALITAITYQALHSCMTGKKGKKAQAEQSEAELNTEALNADAPLETNVMEEEEDYSAFDFFSTIKSAGIKTLCLDEAHHLRSEWWKALEELVKKDPGMTVISLTATPPYDATQGEWERYIGLCGPIDEEIIVPELVKEKSLCPHQDYVYFNMPTSEEEEAVKKFRMDAVQVAEQIFMDEKFANGVSTHVGVCNPKMHSDKLLENPQYLSSLIVFLNAKGLPFSQDLLRMMGSRDSIPSMSLQWLEILLQGFLYDDIDSFSVEESYREELIALLKAHSLIRKNKVGFSANDEVNKLLTMSKGKIRSIVKVVGEEYKNLGEDLRLLILTDYIKKEHMTALGDSEKGVNELGVVPIFENIRREFSKTEAETKDTDLRLAALSGTIVIIPEAAKAELEGIVAERNAKVNIKECGADGYYQVTVSGSEETASGLVTELFNRGAIRVLIGTKSLLGEGWDSPCINSLILASFVGSFMLSNQMRGRAIRVMKGNPGKVSNIWHLICMEPESTNTEDNMLKNPEESDDFATLRRRFEGFLGLNYEEDIIENGLSRLTYIQPPYTEAMVEKMNEQMLALASGRTTLREQWEKTLGGLHNMEVAVETGADKRYFKPGTAFTGACIKLALFGVLDFLVFAKILIPHFTQDKSGFLATLLFLIGLIAGGIFTVNVVKNALLAKSMSSPYRFMQAIGNGVLQAFRKRGDIVSKQVSVGVEENVGLMSYIYLKGGTEREKDVFAQAIYEMFGTVDNQRYLLKAKRKVSKLCKYYCVPELFGKKKEDAQMFMACIAKYIGPYELIYTKNGEGKKALLEGRIHSFTNKNVNCVEKRKRVKSGE